MESRCATITVVVGERSKISFAMRYSAIGSSALDPIAEYRIAKLIFDRSPTTTVMVAHRLSTVVDADRIYLLSDGRIIESGTHAELMAQNGKYREMFLKQAEGYLKA